MVATYGSAAHALIPLPRPIRMSQPARKARGHVEIAAINRGVFMTIARAGFVTIEHIILAVRGEYRTRDGYVRRAVRKLVNHGYVAMLQRFPGGPAIYCVATRCSKGRELAQSLCGDQARVINLASRSATGHLDHTLGLATLRIMCELSCRALEGVAQVYDELDLRRRWGEMAVNPDGAVVVSTPRSNGGFALLLEYQRAESSRKTSEGKVTQYSELLPVFERQLGVRQAWVLFVFERPSTWVAHFAHELERHGVEGTFFCGASSTVFGASPSGLWTEPLFFLPGHRGPGPILESSTNR